MIRQFAKGKIWVIALVASSWVITGCGLSKGPVNMADHIAQTHEITVFRSPTCGCCGLWIEHMKASGFQVKDEITEDMNIKEQYGIAPGLASCHTTLVDGYVVEGHVPAEDVQRLLAERPNIAGITVPGMPIGSPGMESGDYVEPYTVFSFTEDGQTAAFAEHS